MLRVLAAVASEGLRSLQPAEANGENVAVTKHGF